MATPMAQGYSYLGHLPCTTCQLESLLEAALAATSIAELEDPVMLRAEVHLFRCRLALARLHGGIVSRLEMRADLGTSLLEPLLTVGDACDLHAPCSSLSVDGPAPGAL